MLTKKYLLVVTVAIFVNAGTRADPLPSQIDMKAAYCVQSIQNAINVINVPNSNATEAQKKILADVLEKANSNLRHLQRYLVARLPYIDPLAIEAAKQQAIDDHAIMVKNLTICSESCRQDKQELAACAKGCNVNVNDKLQEDCRNLSFLPF